MYVHRHLYTFHVKSAGHTVLALRRDTYHEQRSEDCAAYKTPCDDGDFVEPSLKRDSIHDVLYFKAGVRMVLGTCDVSRMVGPCCRARPLRYSSRFATLLYDEN